jgi:hypothetical protein
MRLAGWLRDIDTVEGENRLASLLLSWCWLAGFDLPDY